MREADRALTAVLLENALLKKKGQAFEDFFVQAGNSLWEADFEPWRPQGQLGDMKCDGYRFSEKAVFQCYAPEEFNASKVANKIQVDFEGARRNFGEEMKKWIFVHNHKDGLPSEANIRVMQLRKEHQHIIIEIWTPDDLIRQLLKLPPNDLGILFPTLIKDQKFSAATWALLEECAKENRATASDVDGKPHDRMNRQGLDDALDRFDDDDRDVRRRLLGYSRWYDPATRAEICEKLVAFGYAEELVENNAERLHDAGLIKITENHYLPMNAEICQQAAESLMDEFVRELEE